VGQQLAWTFLIEPKRKENKRKNKRVKPHSFRLNKQIHHELWTCKANHLFSLSSQLFTQKERDIFFFKNKH